MSVAKMTFAPFRNAVGETVVDPLAAGIVWLG
jgi:hypothetical protein